MKDKIKKGILFFVFTVLLLPVLQQCFAFITSGPLYGFIDIAPDVAFSWQKWWDGTYQPEKSSYLNDNVGLRPDLLRLNNQVQYSLFRKSNLNWIVMGKDDCLYQDVNINNYNGRDYQGYDFIRRKMSMLKAVQDTLARLSKLLLVVHAPNQAFFYPEYIPDHLKMTIRGSDNFSAYLRIGDSMGVNQIDFNTWFVSMKNKSKELLYPKQGFHWSVYGSLLAADSLVKYICRMSKIKMPYPYWNKVIHTVQPRGTDNDITQMLNLIYPAAKEIFSYPEVHYAEDNTFVKPNCLYIGDSFLLTWVDDGLMDHTNSWWAMWSNSVYRSNVPHPDELQYRDIWAYDWVKSVQTMDCVILLYTPRDLLRLGDGFIEKMYAYYFPEKDKFMSRNGR